VKESNKTKQTKTTLNRLLAVERFCGFVNDKLDELHTRELTSRKMTKQAKSSITEALDWLASQIKVLRPIATKETLARNCREVYEQENRWVSISELFKKEAELLPTVDNLVDQLIQHPNQR
jgi:hypothetical protein